jgi:hypothetical protein
MLQLTFKQTNSELLVRAAATVLFSTLARHGAKLVSIADLAERPQYGFTASAATEPVGPRLVRITDLQGGRIDWDSVPFCECAAPEKYLLRDDDLLFARTGATTGKTHLVRNPERAVFASYLIRLRPKAGVFAGYLHAFFQSDNYWSQISDEKEGSAQPNVNGEKLAALSIPHVESKLQHAIAEFIHCVRSRQDGGRDELPTLPAPLAEQRLVVARIEGLAAQIYEARTLRQQAAEEAEAIIRTTVSKIDADMRQDHPLTILEHYAKREKGSLRSGPFGSALLHHEFVANGVPAIGIQDVKENRFELTRKWNVTPEKAEELKRYTIMPRDVLVTVMGTLGRVCVVPDEVPQMVSTKHVWTITLDQTKANLYSVIEFGPL